MLLDDYEKLIECWYRFGTHNTMNDNGAKLNIYD